MMRSIIVAILFCLSANCYAQKDTGRAINRPAIALSAGVSLAPERILSPSSTTIWTDYCDPGLCINLAGQYPLFHSLFGLAGMVTYCSNNFNLNKFTAALTTNNPGCAFTDASAGMFQQYAYLLGGCYLAPAGRLRIKFRALAGIEYLSLPNTQDNATNPYPNLATYTSVVIYQPGIGFACDAGVTAEYPIVKGLCAVLNIDMLFSSVSYNDTSYKEYSVHTYQSTFSSSTQMLMFNASLGLCYNFGK